MVRCPQKPIIALLTSSLLGECFYPKQVISDGSACRLRSFIKKNRSGLTKVDELNATPLHHAAEAGQIELMQLIIDDSSCEGNTHFMNYFIQQNKKVQ